MVKVVPIDEIDCRSAVSSVTVMKCKETLLKQGLIEPLVVKQDEKAPYHLAGTNWYDPAYWFAAKELGWKTVIIVTEDKDSK